jgi:hypothetical protein
VYLKFLTVRRIAVAEPRALPERRGDRHAHILADRARAAAPPRSAAARSGRSRSTTDWSTARRNPESLLELDEALNDLAKIDERLARVVECRFFGGMTGRGNRREPRHHRANRAPRLDEARARSSIARSTIRRRTPDSTGAATAGR